MKILEIFVFLGILVKFYDMCGFFVMDIIEEGRLC